MDEFTDYSHPTWGFRLPVPASWQRTEDAQPGVALIAAEPADGDRFLTNVVVTLEEFPDDGDVREWQESAEPLLEEQLQGYTLLDSGTKESGDRVVFHRLARYSRPDTGDVTMEQWAVSADGLGYTLTASAATDTYPQVADLFAAIADRFHIGGPAAN